ncbi:MAG: HTTM domain-containing protein, partial [Bacteroidota bacterium]
MTLTAIKDLWRSLLTRTTDENSGLSLAVFRIGFGLLVAASQIRFLAKGWVEACYLSTDFHFTYAYFEWVKPLAPPAAMYALVVLSLLAALCVAAGRCYHPAATVLFLSFTYLELIEQSWYLNHYYFVSLAAFLLCLVPANQRLVLGKIRPPVLLPRLYTDIFRMQNTLVYFYAGLAKLRSDWLSAAQP